MRAREGGAVGMGGRAAREAAREAESGGKAEDQEGEKDEQQGGSPLAALLYHLL